MPSQLMGIVNVTPDSFSDGGLAFSPTQAVARVEALLAAGADIVDLGAESTRPGAVLLSHAQEWARLEPVLQRIELNRISIDTRHAETARAALNSGIGIINDEGGLRDGEMRRVLANSDCKIVVMHALSIPADAQQVWAVGVDPVAEILKWKDEITTLAKQDGIALERLIFDPGIGFGKRPEQSLALILRARELVAIGGAWLYGHSRKSFLKLFADAPPSERDALTLAFSAQLSASGVRYLRVHDVASHRRLFEAL